MNARPNTEYFRPSEAKAVVGVSRSMIYKWKKQGLLELVKYGGMSFVRMEDVRKIIDPDGGPVGGPG